MSPGNHGAVCVFALALCGLLALFPAAVAETVTFAPGADQISSVGVLDIAENPYGSVFFGTDNGLSVYNGSWRIIHRTFGENSRGLLSDHVLAIGFDGDGNLWLGYPDGLQRLEGGTFVTIQDQQLLKSLDIHGLLRKDREMWIAAGNAGLHQYLDGAWRWFKPGGPEGLACNYVTSMATDPATGSLYVSCREGIWYTEQTGDQVHFSPLEVPGLMPDTVQEIHGDPFGGIYILNSTAILHFTPPGTWTVVNAADLIPGIVINDLTISPDRTLWVATNNGIYGWRDGAVRAHLDSASGIGSSAVKKVYLDGSGRLWFVTPETVGYTTTGAKAEAGSPVIPITTFELPTTTPVPVTPLVPSITPGLSISSTPEGPASPPDPMAGLLGKIMGFFRQFLGR